MSFSIYQLRNRWFVNDFPVILSSSNYARCVFPCCPFGVHLRKNVCDGKEAFVVHRVIFAFHCHDRQNTRVVNKGNFEYELTLIDEGLDVDGCLKKKHLEWQEQALRDAQEVKKGLFDKETAVIYACEHPKTSGREVEVESEHGVPFQL